MVEINGISDTDVLRFRHALAHWNHAVYARLFALGDLRNHVTKFRRVNMPCADHTVPITCGLLTTRELEITDTIDVEILLHKLRTAEWSSVDVTTAFYKRAIIAQQLTNCLTEIFVERAVARAKEVDDYLRTTGKVIGPLHGLPISLKDQFCIKGLETIMGYAGWIGRYAEHDSVLVEMLYECGGEGALIAMRGSPLGVGTDIGGSVRIPSAFCGLYTLCPSYDRLPYCNAVNVLKGQESISSSLGPMANSLSAVKIFTKAIIDAKPWRKDPLAVHKAWSDGEYALSEHGSGGKMCFAIMWDNGVIKPHPPLVRAMKMTKLALEAAGNTVIDWEPHRHLEIYKNAETIFAADEGTGYRTECALSGEPLIQTMRPSVDAHEYPLDEPFAKTIVGKVKHLNAYELWKLHEEKRALRKSHLDHWEATVARTGTGRPVDAIISPAVACAACPHGCNSDAFYTTFCNILNYPSAVFPVTFADAELDKVQPPHEFRNHEDEAIYKLYVPELFHGLPKLWTEL
ncbi:Acetamidase [Grifola frondosa]|uniref:Acetamidase n=1 Tax=Grifola frondosa TaxID=5627 RepID=A0A1C7MQ64_GRIFR|nr:Acetamidase [Grifola frondosa]